MGKRKNDISSRVFRFIVSVVILSAFIISIALIIRGVQSADEKKLAKTFSKILSRAHINVGEDKIGDVAGKFIERVANTNISATSTSRLNASDGDVEDGTSKDSSKLVLEVAIISDVQEDLAALSRSLSLIKERNIENVIVIGDLTNFGEVVDLQSVKDILDGSGLVYHVLPGDHDLAQSLSADNFNQVFGKSNYVVDMDGFKFVFLDNSANYTPLIASSLSWFNDEAKDADFIILSQPLFTDGLNLPFSRLYMGSTLEDSSGDFIENQRRVKEQRDFLLSSIRDSAVAAIFAGDHHKSNVLVDPNRDSLSHYTLGAIAAEVNDLPQRLLQSPRLTILNVYDNKSFNIEEMLID